MGGCEGGWVGQYRGGARWLVTRSGAQTRGGNVGATLGAHMVPRRCVFPHAEAKEEGAGAAAEAAAVARGVLGGTDCRWLAAPRIIVAGVATNAA